MRDLTSGNLVFHTLPIEGYATYDIGGVSEDVNVINTAYIAAIVQATFYPKPAPAPTKATPSITGSAIASGAPSPTAPASSAGAAGTASGSPTPSSVTIPTSGAQGGAVGTGNGIPCVN